MSLPREHKIYLFFLSAKASLHKAGEERPHYSAIVNTAQQFKLSPLIVRQIVNSMHK